MNVFRRITKPEVDEKAKQAYYRACFVNHLQLLDSGELQRQMSEKLMRMADEMPPIIRNDDGSFA